MNKRFIDWDNYEAEFKKRWAEKDLKEDKICSISYIEEKNRLNRWDIYYSHWEDWLSSSDYFKNWREKINNFQTAKEVNFYTDRLRAFIDFVKDHTRKDISYIENAKPWDPEKTPRLIEQELKRLENISEEEFKKTDKWSKSVEWREMTSKEISDMLDYQSTGVKVLNKPSKEENSKSEAQQFNGIKPQKDNNSVGVGKVLGIIGIIGVVIIASAVVVKSKLNRKVKK